MNFFKIVITIMLFCLITTLSHQSQAQTTVAPNQIRRSVATIMFAGLAGAVLGMSTLSFYGEPQEHINNIWLGLAMGAMGGTAYVLNQSRAVATTNMTAPQNPNQVMARAPTVFAYRFEF